ncbi:glutathione S-transferase N-terminal domain-containing protein [Xanthobacter autotrophicus DSM 431]|uniref:glutathione S-transferase N-terminal domain-containing protein n=1 Tax=Xanthobacter nonsaccharivorans TaxID=3119912 RepID=UPI00372919D4
MQLRLSPTSPFARKVRVAAALLGQTLELEPADTLNPGDTLRSQNPLGKVPTLVTADGEVLFDSSVILAYLDHLAGGHRIVPAEPKARFAALRKEALADGMMDAGILVLYEARFRPQEKHEPKWLEHQSQKMARALAAFEAEAAPFAAPATVGDIALGCALGWFDFRFGGAWRADHPRLVAWYEGFVQACPGFEASKPVA